MAGVSRVTFSESNDARPTYFVAAISIALLALDQVAFHLSASHISWVFSAAIIMAVLAAIFGLYCVLGCIWHPIPKELRADGQLTTLHLGATPQTDQDQSSPLMFESLDDTIAAGDEELVDSSQIEVRDPIQWLKLVAVVACIGINFALISLLSW